MSHLLEFYGKECPHCVEIEPLVERLEKELQVEVNKLECWHDEANQKLCDEYDQGLCGGVPFFYNTKTKKFICGEANYEELKKWALGE